MVDNSPVLCGEMSNPRALWLMDRMGRDVVEAPQKFGFSPKDQVAVFEDGRFDVISAFLGKVSKDGGDLRAVVFFLLGMDELAEDAPPSLRSATIEDWFPKNGPRQIIRNGEGEVAASYRKLVDGTLEKFDEAKVFSSNPPARRSRNGHLVSRAQYVTTHIKSAGPRHHHFSILNKYHGSRSGKKIDPLGGSRPIHERFFEDDGVMLTKPALTGAVVRARMFVDSFIEDKSPVNPSFIQDLRMFY